MTGHIYIGTNACNGLRVDRQRVAGAALAVDAQRIEAAVLVQVADGERGDFGVPQTDLQPDREDGAVAQSGDRCVRRGVEQLPSLRLSAGVHDPAVAEAST
jgi:hypothetical protein